MLRKRKHLETQGVLYLFGRTRETILQSVRVTGHGAVGLEAPRSVVEIL